MVLSSNLQTAILRYFGESASACPNEINIECQAEAPRKASISLPPCKDFPVYPALLSLWPALLPGTAVQPPAFDVLSQTCGTEGSQTDLQALWCHWIPLYLQGPVCPYRLLQEGNFLCGLSFFEGQHGENYFDILGFRPGLPTCPRYVIRGVNPTPCRKPPCLTKATNGIRTLQAPSVTASGQPSMAFCECGRSLGDKPLLQ